VKSTAQIIEFVSTFIRDKVKAAGCRGAVVGVSGGLDSAVVVGLSKIALPETTLGLIMPCYSDAEDEKLARQVLAHFDVPYKTILLDPVFDAFQIAAGECSDKIALGNIKSRLRMIANYYFANQLNYVVLGTGNKAELTVGYFTKYGDGGSDLLPIGDLPKAKVREVARYLGVPQQVVDRAPSGGLWEGQTDEAEMGIAYDDIDKYLCGEPVAADTARRIEQRIRQHEHKRIPPQIATICEE